MCPDLLATALTTIPVVHLGKFTVSQCQLKAILGKIRERKVSELEMIQTDLSEVSSGLLSGAIVNVKNVKLSTKLSSDQSHDIFWK